MWSLGCISAELFLGLPLFPGSSEYNQVTRITNMLDLPSLDMIKKGKTAKKFFNISKYGCSLKELTQFQIEEKCIEQPSKQYFPGKTLNEVIKFHENSSKKNDPSRSPIINQGDTNERDIFVDFLTGLLQIDPNKRWSPQKAKSHPFISGKSI